jgi:hypothetical protein
MAFPTDQTVSRLGQQNATGDARALFLKLYAGEVLTAFEEKNIFMPLHRRCESHTKAPRIFGRIKNSIYIPLKLSFASLVRFISQKIPRFYFSGTVKIIIPFLITAIIIVFPLFTIAKSFTLNQSVLTFLKKSKQFGHNHLYG